MGALHLVFCIGARR